MNVGHDIKPCGNPRHHLKVPILTADRDYNNRKKPILHELYYDIRIQALSTLVFLHPPK
jgi:hypothetical protein